MYLSSVAAGSALATSCEQPGSLCFTVCSVSDVPAKCCSWSFLLVQSCSLYTSLGFHLHKKTGHCGKGEHSTVVLMEPGELRDSVLLHAREGVWGGKCDSGSLQIKIDGYQTGKKVLI